MVSHYFCYLNYLFLLCTFSSKHSKISLTVKQDFLFRKTSVTFFLEQKESWIYPGLSWPSGEFLHQPAHRIQGSQSRCLWEPGSGTFFIINGMAKTTNSINFLCIMFRLYINLVRYIASFEMGNTPLQRGSAVHGFSTRALWAHLHSQEWEGWCPACRHRPSEQAPPACPGSRRAPPYRLVSHSVSHHFDLHACSACIRIWCLTLSTQL